MSGAVAGNAARRPRTSDRIPATLVLLAALANGCAPGVFLSERPDPTLYPEPRDNAITFWGHACAYIDVGGFGIVTDPVFAPSFSILHKRKIGSPPLSAYDQTSVILISHAHQDHLNPESLSRFPKTTTILCPAPSEKHVRDLGPAVRVMHPGDAFPIPGGRIIAVPALHPGGRLSRHAEADGRALGYVIQAPAVTIYYSGDTEYFAGIDSVGRNYHPDIALLNVNTHLKPRDARRAANVLGARVVIPIHSVTYDGPRAGRDRRWRGELSDSLAPRAIPLAIGESLALSACAAPLASDSTSKAGVGGRAGLSGPSRR